MVSFVAKAAIGLTAIAAAGVGAWSWATAWHPSSAKYPLQGIDLPENPPAVEWGSVRASGADFAYIVATSGADRRDPRFEANWAALPQAGLRRGAVHLYSLCQRAVAQADAFNTFVPRSTDALPAAVDLDYRDDCIARPERPALAKELARFVERIEAHTGKAVLLRISRPMERDYALSTTIARPIWAVGNAFPPDYASSAWRIWRASDIRRIDGIEGPVNWDVVAP
ncbi:GH25 family lysozyme [Sphingomonas sp.]|uniref:GH25 family lysozyme n=1 Tax=Sphingomonas sp. TaxID=28214 RepID=UPI002ED83DF0